MLSSENEDGHSNSSTNNIDVQEQRGTSAKMNSSINVYPNPSTNGFTIASMQDVPIKSLAVFNLSGKLVYSEENIEAARYECVHNLEGGTYFLLIKCVDGSTHRKKIVVL